MASYQCRGKKKLWSVRFEIVDNGKCYTKRLSGFERKKDAEFAYRKFLEEFEYNKKNKGLEPQDLTFKSLYEEYCNYIKQRNKPSTHYDFVSKTRLHILPFFEKFNVKQITSKDILEWQTSVNSYSYNYKCHLRNNLSALLSYAEKYYDVPNQLKKVDSFRNLEFKQVDVQALRKSPRKPPIFPYPI